MHEENKPRVWLADAWFSETFALIDLRKRLSLSLFNPGTFFSYIFASCSSSHLAFLGSRCRPMDPTASRWRWSQKTFHFIPWTGLLPPPSRSCCASSGRGTLGALWASACCTLATGWCTAAEDQAADPVPQGAQVTHLWPGLITAHFYSHVYFVASDIRVARPLAGADSQRSQWCCMLLAFRGSAIQSTDKVCQCMWSSLCGWKHSKLQSSY